MKTTDEIICKLCGKEKPREEMNRFIIMVGSAARKEREGYLVLYVCRKCQAILNKHIEDAYQRAKQEVTSDMLYAERFLSKSNIRSNRGKTR